MIKAISIPGKLERYAAIDELDAKVVESFEEKEYAIDSKEVVPQPPLSTHL